MQSFTEKIKQVKVIKKSKESEQDSRAKKRKPDYSKQRIAKRQEN